MKGNTFRYGGVWVLMILATGMFAVTAAAQDMPPTSPEAAMAVSSTATVTLMDDSLTIDPAMPGPGSVTFTIVNDSSQPRGLVISGLDRADTPIIRYSELIPPGGSSTESFFLFLGQSYTFRDYTSRSVVGGEMQFESTYSSTLQIPAPAGYGRGPSFPRQQTNVTITNDGLQVGEIEGGPTTFFVTNQSSRSRGVVLTGVDRAGTPIIRYSRILRPGQSTRVNFWLFGGQNYTIRDYTSRRVVDGDLRFASTFSESFAVPEIPIPPRFGAGPSISDDSTMPDSQMSQ